MEELEFVIDKKGNIKTEAKGFKGKTCLDAITDILSKEVVDAADKQAKPEFYDKVVVNPATTIEHK